MNRIPVAARLNLARGVLTVVCLWLALLAWRGFGDQPGRFTGSVLLIGLALAVVGWAVRLFGRLRWAAPVVQLGLAAWWAVHAGSGSWLPRRTTIAQALETLRAGLDVAQSQPTPVPAIYPEFTTLLIAGALLLIVVGDVLVCGLNRPALLGLPLLVILTLAAVTYLQPVSVIGLLLSAMAWLSVIMLADRSQTDTVNTAPGWHAAGRIAVGAAAAALWLPLVVPAQHLPGAGEGDGDGTQGTQLINPVLNLKRDLTQGADIDLVTARTTANPTYLRLSVLDEFTGSVWRPSPRGRDAAAALDQPLPGAEGLTSRVQTTQTAWSIQVSKQFQTTWLPVPYPTTRVADVAGQWRANPSTLDITSLDGRTAAGYSYRLNALVVAPTKAQLASAPYLTGPLAEKMTALPDGMPPVFAKTARRVTRGSQTNYERAVRLQRWFRDAGGFSYTTAAQPGTGMSTLANFISINRTGYCEQYATAMAVLARELGIPSRVVVGFLRPETSGDLSVYSTRDLHAWPELFFAGVGWVRFEPTPGVRAATVPTYTRGPLRPDSAPTAKPSASATPAPDVPLPKPLPAQQAKPTDASEVPWWIWVLLAVGVAAGVPRGVRSLRRRRRLSALEAGQLSDGIWAELRDSALDAGLRWSEGRSPRRVETDLKVASAVVAPEALIALHDVLDFVERQRYDIARPVTEAERDRLVRSLLVWQDAVAALDGSPRTKWWPKSLGRRSWLPR